MDYKDILAIIIVVIFMLLAAKFFPGNPFGMIGNYIKAFFSRK